MLKPELQPYNSSDVFSFDSAPNAVMLEKTRAEFHCLSPIIPEKRTYNAYHQNTQSNLGGITMLFL